MAPTLIFDIADIDLTQVQYDTKAVEEANPQRGDMRHLDGIIFHKDNGKPHAIALGYKDIRDDEFWVPGHIPGRPIFPGVLMIEAAAQLSAFLMKKRLPNVTFAGFTGIDNVKFRGQVVPGDRLYILGKEIQIKPRRFICQCQALVNGSLVFEAKITGMPF